MQASHFSSAFAAALLASAIGNAALAQYNPATQGRGSLWVDPKWVKTGKTISFAGTGLCLEAQNGVYRDWTPILLAPCNGSARQQFAFDGPRIRLGPNTNLCLDRQRIQGGTDTGELNLENCSEKRTSWRFDSGRSEIRGTSRIDYNICIYPLGNAYQAGVRMMAGPAGCWGQRIAYGAPSGFQPRPQPNRPRLTAGGTPAPRPRAGLSGGPAYCRMYASTTAGTVSNALKGNPSCVDYSKGVHADYKMHYDWCMRTPTSEVEGAANHIRDLSNQCLRQGARGRPVGRPAPARSSTTKWSGPWNWVRPLVLDFSIGRNGRGAPPPGPRDVTVRKRENASFELLPNNRVRICIASNPCNVYPFNSNNNGYIIDYHSAFINVWTNDQGRTLEGQFWWDKKKRTQITPDATFVLNR